MCESKVWVILEAFLKRCSNVTLCWNKVSLLISSLSNSKPVCLVTKSLSVSINQQKRYNTGTNVLSSTILLAANVALGTDSFSHLDKKIFLYLLDCPCKDNRPPVKDPCSHQAEKESNLRRQLFLLLVFWGNKIAIYSPFPPPVERLSPPSLSWGTAEWSFHIPLLNLKSKQTPISQR